MQLSKIGLLFLITIILATCQENKSTGQNERRPNVILILADDAGYGDFGFMGSKDIDTPHLDTLAEDGVILTDAHVSASVCAPSRAGLITGLYQQRFGHECNDIPNDSGLDLQTETLGDLMQDAGYVTGVIGKWHLGLGAKYHPNIRGFDFFYGFLAGARSYFSKGNEDKDGAARAILRNQTREDFEGYLTDRLGDEAVQFVHENKHDHFFLYLSFNAPHTPMHAKQEHLEKYANHPRKTYASMMYSMDENIGKLVQKLKADKLYDNTLIFFLSDNGGAMNNKSTHGQLKGWKGNKFEAGHRVPMTITWADELKGGSTFDKLSSSLDIHATIAHLVNADVESDGVNLIPYLRDENQDAPHKQLFWRKDKMAAARDDNYKLIRLDDYGFRLYDLKQDISESKNLTERLPAKFELLKENLVRWEENMQEPKWTEAAIWDTVTYEIHQALMENRSPNYIAPNEYHAYINKNK